VKRHSQRYNFQPKQLLAIVLIIWSFQILITANISPQTLAIIPIGNNLLCPFEVQRPATGAKYSGEPFDLPRAVYDVMLCVTEFG
jgi:hypothetical protein